MKTQRFVLDKLFFTVVLLLVFTACDNSPKTVTYTISYNANGGSGTVPVSQTANEGTRITLSGGNNLYKDSYIFGGWTTNPSGTGTIYSAGSFYTVSSDVVFYAKWSEQAYTVTFLISGGTGTAPSELTVEAGSVISLPGGSGFTRTGYTFTGWLLNGTFYSAGSSYTVTRNVTFIANWEQEAATPPTGPSTPTVLAAPSGFSISYTRELYSKPTWGVKLTWNHVSGASSYDIQTSTDGATWSRVVSAGFAQIQFSLAAPNTQYQCRVRARHNDVTSEWSIYTYTTPPL